MMNALQQYIDLYDANRDTVEKASPAVMNRARVEARRALSQMALPVKGSEDYEATDLNAIFATDYGVNLNQMRWQGELRFSCDVPNLSTNVYYVLNDTFVAGASAREQDGLTVETLAQAALRHPDVLERCYGVLSHPDSPTTALNTLLAQNGILIYVEAGYNAERPIQIVNVLNADMPLLAVRRVLVVAEPGSSVKVLVCDHTQNSSRNYLSSEVVEIVAREGATVDYYHMEESTPQTSRVSDLYVRQEAGSNVLVDGITLTNGTTRNNYYIDVAGEHAQTRLLGMAIAGGEQHVDSYTRINHRAPRCKSDEMFKYVLTDRATGAFAGKILVQPDCPRVEAYQGNKNICGSKEAKMHTKPQLEIYTDDVKCSHGATVGQLDEEALFYMQTRGVSHEQARRLLMQAFVSDVIAGVRLDVLRERLYHLVERRLDGNDAMCADCRINK